MPHACNLYREAITSSNNIRLFLDGQTHTVNSIRCNYKQCSPSDITAQATAADIVIGPQILGVGLKSDGTTGPWDRRRDTQPPADLQAVIWPVARQATELTMVQAYYMLYVRRTSTTTGQWPVAYGPTGVPSSVPSCRRFLDQPYSMQRT